MERPPLCLHGRDEPFSFVPNVEFFKVYGTLCDKGLYLCFEGWARVSLACIGYHYLETTNASDYNKHMNTSTGVLSGKM